MPYCDNISINSEIPDAKIYKWLQNIEDSNKRLSLFSSNSEKQFLAISNSLYGFNSKSKEITQSAFNIAGHFVDSEFQGDINSLENIFEGIFNHLSLWQKKFTESGLHLDQVIGTLNLIYTEVSGFNKLVRHLRIHGISIKIESARLGSDDKGFNNIAENVGNLSVLISEKSLKFNEKVKSLLSVINKFSSQIETSKNRLTDNSDEIIKNKNTSLTSLNKKLTAGSDKAEFIHTAIQTINKEISSLITFVQYHDITRQQIESVSSALKSLAVKIKSANDYKNDKVKYQQLINSVYDIISIETAQLKNSREQLVKAVDGIISSLKNISGNISNLSGEILGLLDDTENSSPFIESLNLKLSAVVSSLMENSAAGNQFSGSAKQVLNVINELSDFINQVSEIGAEIELISLNASIKAARAGSEGAGLSVLASAIQKLSADSKKEISPVIAHLTDISEKSSALEAIINDQNTNEEQQKLILFNSGINSTLNSLNSIVTDSLSGLHKLRDLAYSFGRELNKTADNITVHTEAEKIINGIIFQLEDVNSECAPFVDKKVQGEHHLEEYRKNYTMQVQRDIHDSVSEGAPGEGIIPGKDGLGDNVELF